MVDRSNILMRDPLLSVGIVLICWGALSIGLIAEYGFGVDPCVLCNYQRIAYGVAGMLALLSLPAWRGEKDRKIVFGLCGAVLVVGAGIAFYHVGVEQHWWNSYSSCGGTISANMSLSDVLSQLTVKQPKACDEIDFALFGISMATYNIVIFLVLAFAALKRAAKIRREATA
ncbi:MAG: disulfide bond formation protein B [Rhodospirillales bacterium]|nr:disulfide bond formation protein B [Rhodospirillales bacterium]